MPALSRVAGFFVLARGEPLGEPSARCTSCPIFITYLDEREITDDRKVFHSFRHTFINRMTELHIHPAMLMALVGHYDQAKVDFSSPHFANYQHAKPLVELKATLARFDVKLPLTF